MVKFQKYLCASFDGIEEHKGVYYEVYKNPNGKIIKKVRMNPSLNGEELKRAREGRQDPSLSPEENMKIKLEKRTITQEVYDAWYARYTSSPENTSTKVTEEKTK